MRIAIVLIVFLHLTAPWAGAQTRVDVVPSVSIGSIYDNNLFAKTKGSAGQMLTMRPGFDMTVKSPRLELGSEWSFDAQRSNFATLNTFDARRHATVDMRYRASAATMLGFGARYDRTETPGDIDIDTGILGDRQQAHRLEITPSFSQRLRPRTFLRASYTLADESQVDSGAGRLHTLRTGLTHDTSDRTTLTASYMGRQFVDAFETNTSSSALVGAERVLAPHTRVTFQAGPRFSTYRSVQPEILAGFIRSTNRVGLVFDYWHGETIVLGIRGPVAVDSLSARAVFPLTQHIEIGTHTGLSDISTLDDRKVTVYRGTLVASWSPDAWYTISGSYGIDYQLGDIRHPRGFVDDTGVLLDDRVLRHVLRVSFTVAPRLSRSIQSPADPAARAKGVTR